MSLGVLTWTFGRRQNGPQFGRTLRFIVFDDFAYPFFRGGLSISRVGFMIEREIALGFPRDTNPELLLRILGHEAFAGDRPTLHVETSAEWNLHYVFTLSAGARHQTGSWTLHQAALGKMEEAIKGSIAICEAAMVDGLVTDEDVAGFLTLAERWYASRYNKAPPTPDGPPLTCASRGAGLPTRSPNAMPQSEGISVAIGRGRPQADAPPRPVVALGWKTGQRPPGKDAGRPLAS